VHDKFLLLKCSKGSLKQDLFGYVACVNNTHSSKQMFCINRYHCVIHFVLSEQHSLGLLVLKRRKFGLHVSI